MRSNTRRALAQDAPFIETSTAEKLPRAATGAPHSYEAFPPLDAYEGLIEAMGASGHGRARHSGSRRAPPAAPAGLASVPRGDGRGQGAGGRKAVERAIAARAAGGREGRRGGAIRACGDAGAMQSGVGGEGCLRRGIRALRQRHAGWKREGEGEEQGGAAHLFLQVSARSAMRIGDGSPGYRKAAGSEFIACRYRTTSTCRAHQLSRGAAFLEEHRGECEDAVDRMTRFVLPFRRAQPLGGFDAKLIAARLALLAGAFLAAPSSAAPITLATSSAAATPTAPVWGCSAGSPRSAGSPLIAPSRSCSAGRSRRRTWGATSSSFGSNTISNTNAVGASLVGVWATIRDDRAIDLRAATAVVPSTGLGLVLMLGGRHHLDDGELHHFLLRRGELQHRRDPVRGAPSPPSRRAAGPKTADAPRAVRLPGMRRPPWRCNTSAAAVNPAGPPGLAADRIVFDAKFAGRSGGGLQPSDGPRKMHLKHDGCRAISRAKGVLQAAGSPGAEHSAR